MISIVMGVNVQSLLETKHFFFDIYINVETFLKLDIY